MRKVGPLHCPRPSLHTIGSTTDISQYYLCGMVLTVTAVVDHTQPEISERGVASFDYVAVQPFLAFRPF